MQIRDVVVLVGMFCAFGLGASVLLSCGSDTPDHSSDRQSSSDQLSTAEKFQMLNATQLRGLHMAMIIYSRNNNGYFPGIDSQGNVVEAALSKRFELLLNGNFIDPDYLVNPADSGVQQASGGDAGFVLSKLNHSYAGLDLSQSGARTAAWSETNDTYQVVLSDRNTGPNAGSGVRSVWTQAPGVWEGTVVRNDGSVRYEQTHRLDTEYAEYSISTLFGQTARMPSQRYTIASDNLFEAVGPHDAWLVHD
ncbi:MAG: hypothetical protein AAGI68_16440 [Planctomycetota bacterium]